MEKRNESVLQKLYESIGEETGKSFLVALWLLKKYKVPYSKGKTKGGVNYEDREGTIKLLKDVLADKVIIDKRKSKNPYYTFVNFTIDQDIFELESNSVTNSYVKICEDIAAEMDASVPEMVASYLSECAEFDRAFPDAVKLYMEPMLEFQRDIETSGIFDMRKSNAYWSLLCAIVGGIDDLDPAFKKGGDTETFVADILNRIYAGKDKADGLKPDNLAKTTEYLFNKALAVRDEIIKSNDPDNYLESRQYLMELNMLAYSLIHLDTCKRLDKPFGYYEETIRNFYNVIQNKTQNLSYDSGWLALSISNIGAVESQYGSYIEAVKYDLRALSLKESRATDMIRRNIIVDEDLSLTIIRSHVNIVRNAVNAIFELEPKKQLSNKKITAEGMRDRLSEYVMLAGIHAVEAVRLRAKIMSEKAYPTRIDCADAVKGNLVRLALFLEELNRDMDSKGFVSHISGVLSILDTVSPECRKFKYSASLEEFSVKRTFYKRYSK